MLTTSEVTSEGIALMSSAELSIGIACASISTYKPLFTRYSQSSSDSDSESQNLTSLTPQQQEKFRAAYGGSVTPQSGGNMDVDEHNWNLKDSGFLSSCPSPTSERRFDL